MKKQLILLAIALFGISSVFAQTPAKQATKVKTTANKPSAAIKTEVKTVAVKTNAPVVVKKEVKKVTVAGPTKKDGTADMRYKVNKNKTVKVVGPTKKDGTADMRFKSNKEAAKKN
ncbi:MAG TPA: hypothetical protein VL088_09375 [Pedobacter sp.]|nr:hypothetical protein [Pedobacter sp.]